MGAPRDPVWEHTVGASKAQYVKCVFCGREMFRNPTWVKKHIVGKTCKPPRSVKILLLKRIVEKMCSGDAAEYAAELASLEADGDGAAVRLRAAAASASTSTGTGETGTLDNFVRTMSSKNSTAIDVKCARWIFRRAMPLNTTAMPEFIDFIRALNPAYAPPSRYSLSGPLLEKEFKQQTQVVNMFVRRSIADGDIVLGGDGWTDRLNNSIYNVMLFTPEPVYAETKVWGESKHTAENTARFFIERIESLGARNVCAFVSDTESKMKAVWDMLKERYPWLLIIPCGAHCLDLLHGDIAKHPDIARALAFCNSMVQYWKTRAFPKSVLERCQVAEYEKRVQLQRPNSTRWSSQVTAASVLLQTQGAMEKAVVDAAFKNECINSGTAEQRKAAADATRAVKDEANWELLDMVVKLLGPLKLALDNAQSNGRGLGKVRSAMFRLQQHFTSFEYPQSSARTMLRQHVIKCFLERKSYALCAVHSLAYVLDPRYADHPAQPDTPELAEALDLLCSMAAAHDIKLAIAFHNIKNEVDLPANYSTATADSIMGEYTGFKAKSVGHFVLPSVWQAGTVNDPLAWWKLWGTCVPHLQAVAIKVMKLPVGFAAGERSFSNAANIQSKLRSRLSYDRLHKLLFVYFNSRSLPQMPPGMGPDTEAAQVFGSGSVQLDGVHDGDAFDEDEVDMGNALNEFAREMEAGHDDGSTPDDREADDSSLRMTQESTSL